jgi:hypothetical protein
VHGGNLVWKRLPKISFLKGWGSVDSILSSLALGRLFDTLISVEGRCYPCAACNCGSQLCWNSHGDDDDDGDGSGGGGGGHRRRLPPSLTLSVSYCCLSGWAPGPNSLSRQTSSPIQCHIWQVENTVTDYRPAHKKSQPAAVQTLKQSSSTVNEKYVVGTQFKISICKICNWYERSLKIDQSLGYHF